MMGRPSDYTPEIALKICERIIAGESVRDIGGDPDMPADRTIFRWLAAHEEFRQQYARAKEFCADVYLDDIVAISDEPVTDMVQLGHNKLRSDNRKWAASKLHPKKYGDKLALDHSGEMTINSRSDDELRARLSQLVAAEGSGNNS